MLVAALVGYLLGSIPTAQIVARRAGVDPHLRGDGNPGWWNMRTLVGERLAFIVFAGDVVKGVLAGLAGVALWGPWWVVYVAVFAALVGHAFPVFAGFRGGRSLLTWAGGMLVLSPLATLIAIGLGAVAGGVTRRFAWGGRVAFVAMPVAQAFFDPRAYVAVTGAMMTFIGLRFLFARVPGTNAPSTDAEGERFRV